MSSRDEEEVATAVFQRVPLCYFGAVVSVVVVEEERGKGVGLCLCLSLSHTRFTHRGDLLVNEYERPKKTTTGWRR